MCKLDDEKMKNIEIAAVGAGLSGRFNHTSKLKMMKFKEAINRPDKDNEKKKSKRNTNKW